MNRKYNMLAMQCLLFWLLDYGSDANYVTHQYALIQWTAFLVPGIPSQSQCH